MTATAPQKRVRVKHRTPRGKNERLQARLSTQQRALLVQAAAIEGRSLTDFTVAAAMAAARQTIMEHRVLALSERDAAAFLTALATPWSPSEEALAEARHMEALVGEE